MDITFSLPVNICKCQERNYLKKITSPIQMRKFYQIVYIQYGMKIELNHRVYSQHLCVGFCTWKAFFPECLENSAIELKFYLGWKIEIYLFKSKCTEWMNLSFYRTCLILILSSKTQNSFILKKYSFV